MQANTDIEVQVMMGRSTAFAFSAHLSSSVHQLWQSRMGIAMRKMSLFLGDSTIIAKKKV